jgi:hypothetical protein
MKHSFCLVFALAFGIVCTIGGPAVAGPARALLVDENGDLIAGYSPVIVEDGLAYPVCSEKEGVWYIVHIVGETPDGTVLCTIGERMGEIPEGVSTGDGGPGEVVEDEGGRPGEAVK